MHAIPVIDLSETSSVPNAIDAAFREAGFLLVNGHGIPLDADIEHMHAVFSQFFARPLADKRRVQIRAGHLHGWSGSGRSRLADTLGTTAAPGPEGDIQHRSR